MEVETLGSKANARLWLTALQRVDSIEPWAAEQATAETAELTMNLASTKHPMLGRSSIRFLSVWKISFEVPGRGVPPFRLNRPCSYELGSDAAF